MEYEESRQMTIQTIAAVWPLLIIVWIHLYVTGPAKINHMSTNNHCFCSIIT